MNTEHNNGCETISTPLGERVVYRLGSLGNLETLPYSIRVLLESCLRVKRWHAREHFVENHTQCIHVCFCIDVDCF